MPRVVFVLGKGGVGRTTVATALGLELARLGQRTCVFGWSISDQVAPWFGLPPAGLSPIEIAPRLHVANYRLEDTLELYFVKHLHLSRFYRHVIRGASVRKLIDAAPGIAEVFFIGHLWWLTTLAAEEAGLCFDRVVVDAPATGHGVSLFDVPSVLRSLGAAGLVAVETERVVRMMTDPAWTGALVVTLPEELSAEETAELVPSVASRLARKPLMAIVNRAAGQVAGGATVDALRARISSEACRGLDAVVDDLRARASYEGALRELLAGATENGVITIGEQWMKGLHRPREVLESVQAELRGHLGETP